MKQWPHAPLHRLGESGTYIVTASTYGRQHHFATVERLNMLQSSLLALAEKYGWLLQAWAVFSNHYHFVAASPTDPSVLSRFMNHLHSTTARTINALDDTPGRKVWFQYWDMRIDRQKSLLNRLAYVDQNAVHHRLVKVAANYPWCSATWFELHGDRAFVNTVRSMPIDGLGLQDVDGPILPLDFQQGFSDVS